MRQNIRAAFGLLEVFLLFVTPLVFYRGFSDQFTFTKQILTEALILLGVTLVLLRFIWTGRDLNLSFRKAAPASVLVIAALLSCINSPAPDFSLAKAAYFICGPLWLLFLTATESGEQKIVRFAKMITAASCIVAVIAIMQWLWRDPLIFGGYDVQFGVMSPVMRLYSTFGNPNLAAGYLIGAVFAAIGLGMIGAACAAITIVAVFAMNSQGAWLGLVLGALVFWGYWGQPPNSRIRRLSPIFLLIGIGALLMVAPQTSIEGRVYLWRASAPMFLDHPVLGSGMGAFQLRFPDLQAQFLNAHPEDRHFYTYTDQLHNDPLQLLLEGGIVTLAALMWLLWNYVGELRAARAVASDTQRVWLAASAGGVTAILSNACFNFQLAVPPTLILLFTLLAIPRMLHVNAGEVAARPRRLSFQVVATAVTLGISLWLGGGIVRSAQGSRFQALGRDTANAEQFFRRGLEWDSENGDLQYALARVLYIQGSYDEALLFASRAGRTVPDPHLEVLKARIYDQMGQHGAALASFQHALWLDPTLDSVRPDIERLSRGQ